MFGIVRSKAATGLIFVDDLGRKCMVAGYRAGAEVGRLQIGLHEASVVFVDTETNELEEVKIDHIGLTMPKSGRTVMLRGMPMVLTQAQVRQLLPVLQYFATHGVMPPDALLESEANGDA